MWDAPRLLRAKETRCCICSTAIEGTPAHLVIYWPERDEPIALDAHASCLEQRTPLLDTVSTRRAT